MLGHKQPQTMYYCHRLVVPMRSTYIGCFCSNASRHSHRNSYRHAYNSFHRYILTIGDLIITSIIIISSTHQFIICFIVTYICIFDTFDTKARISRLYIKIIYTGYYKSPEIISCSIHKVFIIKKGNVTFTTCTRRFCVIRNMWHACKGYFAFWGEISTM